MASAARNTRMSRAKASRLVARQPALAYNPQTTKSLQLSCASEMSKSVAKKTL